MPLDPVRVADVAAWLGKAETDLRAAEHDRVADPPLAGDTVFHCQQAVEKAFKAFLTWAWRFRYPGEPADPSLAEVDEALTVAREAYEEVVGRLPFGTAK